VEEEEARKEEALEEGAMERDQVETTMQTNTFASAGSTSPYLQRSWRSTPPTPSLHRTRSTRNGLWIAAKKTSTFAKVECIIHDQHTWWTAARHTLSSSKTRSTRAAVRKHLHVECPIGFVHATRHSMPGYN
jgi:hypothetical protein